MAQSDYHEEAIATVLAAVAEGKASEVLLRPLQYHTAHCTTM